MIAPPQVQPVQIEHLWGFCPVQAFGIVGDRPFYFRAQFSHWTFSVASTKHGDPVQVAIDNAPGWHFKRKYGYGLDASFMSHMQARILISTTAGYYLNGGNNAIDR